MDVNRKADWPDIAIAAVLIGASMQIPSVVEYVALWLIAGGITVILDAVHCRRTIARATVWPVQYVDCAHEAVLTPRQIEILRAVIPGGGNGQKAN